MYILFSLRLLRIDDVFTSDGAVLNAFVKIDGVSIGAFDDQ